MASQTKTMREARAELWRIADELRSAVSRLDDLRLRDLPVAGGITRAFGTAMSTVEDVATDLEDAAEQLEALRRASDGPLTSATEMLAARTTPGPPDAMALACLVEAVDVGDVDGWEAQAARQALSWLVRRNPRAAALAASLLRQTPSPVTTGDLLFTAKRQR